MADRNKLFIVSTCTREGIAAAFNDCLEASGSDARFAPEDDRLTDAICEKYAARIGGVGAETADADAEAVDAITRDTLVNDLGFALDEISATIAATPDHLPEETMLTVTEQDLHKFLCDETDDLDPALVDALKGCDIMPVIADFAMSEHHLGGDDVIEIVDKTVEAVREGYTIVTWYGKNAEVLVAGIRPYQITITE